MSFAAAIRAFFSASPLSINIFLTHLESRGRLEAIKKFRFETPGWTVEAHDSIPKELIRINSDGYVNIPRGLGLDVELNEEAPERYGVA